MDITSQSALRQQDKEITMLHFLHYNIDGNIIGTESCAGGYGPDCDPNDPSNESPHSAALRELRKDIKDGAGWVSYECECLTSFCHCAAMRSMDSYVVDGDLARKAIPTLWISGSQLQLTTYKNPASRAPGSSLAVTIKADVPDGHQLELKNGKTVHILENDTTLTFTNGQSQPVTLVAPAQGMIGSIVGKSKLVKQFGLNIRGWAS